MQGQGYGVFILSILFILSRFSWGSLRLARRHASRLPIGLIRFEVRTAAFGRPFFV